ncbi:MAG: 1-deoxy-D-xylulose-5-phosphate synthase N-terminal domain-containing protein, partial [Clostridia bacterium]
IAPNVGALAHYFTKLRTSKSWQGTKRVVKRGVSCIPWIGPPIARGLEWVKEGIRHMLLDGDFFEALGFSYLGPIDGHDMATLIQVLQSASREKRPMLVHVVTQKGKGYTLAENRPEKFHGIAPFFVENGNIRDQKPCGSVPSGNVTTDCLIDMAAEDARVVAITAAMAAGTGLTRFALAYKTRFFDVGIAEAHAVTLAAGMASCGMHPYFAVYSTFLQRAYDQVVHDVCLQRLPVTFLIDRAGFVPGDGATHQGIFDVCFLRTVPNLTLWAPADAEELCAMLRESLRMDTPCAIRYGKQIPQRLADVQGYRIGHWRWMEQGSQMVLITYGALLEEARKAAAQLRTQGVDCGVLHASTIKPLDREQLRTLHARGVCMVVMEEQQHIGGLGSAITDFCQAENMRCPLCCIGVADHFVEQHTVEGLRLANGLTAAQVVETVTAALAAQEGSNE